MSSSYKEKKITGWWTSNGTQPETGSNAIKEAISRVTHPVYMVDMDGHMGVGHDGIVVMGKDAPDMSEGYPLTAWSPPLHPENLGDPVFKKRHNIRYPYIAGAMANGITSTDIVEEMGCAGMAGFFGAGGLTLDKIEAAIDRLEERLKDITYGFNLIHSPNDPDHENAVVQLYLRRGVRLVSAAAYMNLTLPIVYYRVKGIHRDTDGNIICPNKIIAKVSRVEVARKFFSPPPEKFLGQLYERKLITEEEAELARHIPMADDLTAEADSGGHTDNRPALALLPNIIALRDEMVRQFDYKDPVCVGLGGGIATPESTAAAFAMGAAYVLTGSVNQSCVESGTSESVRQMLADAGQADVSMAPAADMFEMGVKVQVLKRGTLFPVRAAKLYEIYSRYNSLEEIPENETKNIEKNFFKCGLQEEWHRTKSFFQQRDPRQIKLAESKPKHKMALIFRSYLGRSSFWAISGDPERKIDFQIWCGPAIGAFNEWVRGTFLEKPENRKVVTVAMNLLYGASIVTRINWLRNQGIVLPTDAGSFSPMELSEIQKNLENKVAN
mgnify:FL=1